MFEREIKEFQREKVIGEQKIETYKLKIVEELKNLPDLEEVTKLKKTKKSILKTLLNVFK